MKNIFKIIFIIVLVLVGIYSFIRFIVLPFGIIYGFTGKNPLEATKMIIESKKVDKNSIEYKNKEQDATIRADFTKQMGLFEIYYSNTGSYDGYCNSITNNSYTCKTFGDKGGYLMYTKLNNNKYFCIDNGYEFKELEKEPFGKTCAE